MRSWARGGLAVALVLPVALALPGGAASATEGTIQSTTSAMWQTNGQVDSLAYGNGKLFAAGSFTSVRPPGAAAGTSETARQYLAAFNSSTGTLLGLGHTFNGAVRSVVTSPDGSKLYVAGSFTTVDGKPHNRLAAFDTSSTALIDAFTANVDYTVNSLGVGPTGTVYLGGGFSNVNKVRHVHVAAVTGDTGAEVPAFTASVDGTPYALAVDGGKLFIGGNFDVVDGLPNRAAATVDAATGVNIPFSAASALPPKSDACLSVVRDIVIANGVAYFGAEGTGGGCFDGTFAARVADGSMIWQNLCLGGTQAVQVVGNWLYKGSHAHDCSQNIDDPDAYPQVVGPNSRHLLAESLSDGKLGPWYPNTNGLQLGPHAMATDGSQLFLGGDFSTVNNKGQQGLARFTPGPDTTPPPAPAAPTVVTGGAGKVNVYVQAPVDQDDPDLNIRIFRDGASTPLAVLPAHSLFWRQPVVAVADTVPAGTTHSYRADAVEANDTGKSTLSAATSATVAGAAGSYASAINGDNPTSYWRLGEASGSIAADSSSYLRAGTYAGTRAAKATGAILGDSDTAVTFDGSTGVAGAAVQQPTPNVFSAEAWFKTSTTSGGKIFGFGNSSTALSTNYDKHVYMLNDGRLAFGVFNGGTATVTSSASYNDGNWHQVSVSQGAGGMALFVDGVRVAANAVTGNQDYAGYWRIGGDNLNGWPNQPASAYFAGSIDEFATYGTTLSKAQVLAHYTASGRAAPPSTAPTDPYGVQVYADSPSLFWRFEDASGTAADASDNGATGSYGAGAAGGAPGALVNLPDKAAVLSGQDAGGAEGVISGPAVSPPSQYSVEAWVKTTTTSGGKLFGFGDASQGYSSSYDKHVYMTDAGRLVFGVWNGQADVVTSDNAYNDGNWHHVVATQGTTGMKLYVDGVVVAASGVTSNQPYNGYWRVGGDNLNSWPGQPTSAYLQGSVDEFAVYGVVLSSTQVAAHFQASGR